MSERLEEASPSCEPEASARRGARHSAPRLPAGPSPARFDAAIGVGLAGLASLWLALGGAVDGRGFLSLVGCKAAALVALGAAAAWRRRAGEGSAGRLVESLTLGSMVAFVVSLSLRGWVRIPPAALLVDWLGTLGVMGLARHLDKPRPGRRSARIAPTELLPEVVSQFRGRRVRVDLPGNRRLQAELRGRLQELGASLVGGDAGPPAHAWILSGGNTREAALRIRESLRQGLRLRAEAIVVVEGADGRDLPRKGSNRGLSLPERIAGALSGLTRTRLIRVRVEGQLDAAAAARRILRVAAKGRDGSIVTMKRTGGSCIEARHGCGDAAELWQLLDRL